ncbi:ArnT family glycosyltransferase [Celerinatantimonas sp. YJH-8]|uniref:ArnT family glycosyltransferase n=1 Tax=Celerinatantimonas sp. YJH-8 TaxID=3228714 RepID=UPI0038C57D95
MDCLKFDHKEFWFKSLWVIVFALAVYATNMSDSDIRGDSIIYADIAKNILSLHSPLILHLNDDVYLNKPPLLFWLVALCLKMFGYTVFAVKVTVVLTSLSLSLSLFYLVARIFKNYNWAYLAVFCLNTTYVVYKATRPLRMESLTATFILLALVCFWLYLKSDRIKYLVWLGICCGLAIFSKGFLGLIPLAVMLLYAVFGDRNKLNWRFAGHFGIVLVVSLMVCGWWYVYISLKTDFIHHFFYEQTAARLLNGALQEGQQVVNYDKKPLYQYLYLMGRDYFMYIPFFLFGCYRLYRDKLSVDREGLRIVVIYAAFSWLSIHLISTRAERYLYEFYTIAAFISAYGIASIPKLKTVQFVNWLKVMGLAYMIFVMATPSKLSWNSYNELAELKQLSQNLQMPLLVNRDYFPNPNDRAGLDFFLEPEHIQSFDAMPQKAFLTVLPKEFQGDLSYRLIRKTRRLQLVMVLPR